MSPLVLVGGVVLDRLLPEPAPHPLAAFGRLADAVERRWNRRGTAGDRLRGALAVAVLAGSAGTAAAALARLPVLGPVVEAGALCLALGGRSLEEHALAVRDALWAGDLAEARRRTGRLVSRDTQALDGTGCARATVESTLENGADAVFGSLFWYVVGGAGAVVAHRLVNTLDAMWGYRMPRFREFGRAAARLDDALNWIPARLAALSYGLVGNLPGAWRAWRSQAGAWDSPNAGPVMAAGAGALGVRLGGGARYQGGWRERPVLGAGADPAARDIGRAVAMVRRALILWLAVILGGWWLV